MLSLVTKSCWLLLNIMYFVLSMFDLNHVLLCPWCNLVKTTCVWQLSDERYFSLPGTMFAWHLHNSLGKCLHYARTNISPHWELTIQFISFTFDHPVPKWTVWRVDKWAQRRERGGEKKNNKKCIGQCVALFRRTVWTAMLGPIMRLMLEMLTRRTEY